MLKQINGRWTLVSKKTQRPLAYYSGEGKPSDEWVKKQEARIQYFKNRISESNSVGRSENIKPDILPKSGAGAWGTDELVKTYMRDTPGQVIKFKDFKKRTK